MLVGLSGGKDSLATLDIVSGVIGHENVTPFLMYVVRGLECEMGPIRRAMARYPGMAERFIETPHPMLGEFLKGSVLRPYVEGSEKIKTIKTPDVEQHLRNVTGIRWVAYGQKCADNIVRRAMLKKDGINGLDERFERANPLWDWSNADVYGYLRGKGITVPPGVGPKRPDDGHGVSLQTDFLVWLRDTWPEDFRLLLRVFPYAETQIARWEMHGRDGGLSKQARKALTARTEKAHG